jgi:hypothetical protein
MKKFTLSLFGIYSILILHTSCTNEKPISTVNVSKPQLDQVSSNNNSKTPEKPKEVIQINEYQLAEISGQFPPRGGFLQYDKKKKKWCSRPSAGDIMSYTTVMELKDPSDIPDLSDYFDQSTTNKLNSCKLLMKSQGNIQTITLYFQGNVIYKNSLELGPNKKGINNIKLPDLRKLNLNGIGEPHMMMENGRNYELHLDTSQPMIKFENEFGNYELRFERIGG